jgi:translation initiation factor 4G
MPSMQGRSQHYPNSPSMATRSPAGLNATLATPQISHPMHMAGQQFPQLGHQGHQGYPQVNRHVSSSVFPPPPFPLPRGRAGRDKGRGRKFSNFNNSKRDWNRSMAPQHGSKSRLLEPPPPVPPHPAHPVDLSPQSGNFERILTAKKQGHVQIQNDPSLHMYYQHSQWMNAQGHSLPNFMPPSSPRPSPAQGSGAMYGQAPYGTMGHPQGHPMSRTPSQMSTSDRPTTNPGQPPTPSMSVVSSHSHSASRATSASISKSDFRVPAKKNAAIVIKNEDGVVQSVAKPSPATSARATPSPVKQGTPPVAGARSRSVSTASHVRNESVNEKSGEEKKRAMQDAVARKIAEDAKIKEDRDIADKKAMKDKGATESEMSKPAEIKGEVVKEPEDAAAASTEPEATTESSVVGIPEVVEPVEADKKAAEAAALTDQQDVDEEDEFEKMVKQMEAEQAAREKKEAESEAIYRAKKQAEKEAQKKKEDEEEAAYYANMKQAEREAEEAEEARQRKKTEGQEGQNVNKPVEAVKAAEALTPPSNDSPAAQTPAVSGAATPISDLSMEPPAKGGAASRRDRPTALTLEISKQIEPPQPSAALKALRSARLLEDPSSVEYPSTVASPNPALNNKAPSDRRFKYNKEFLLQFQNVFKEKPSLDWDAKIRDTIGDGGDSSARPSSARTPSAMTRTGSNRSNAMPAYSNMGTFNVPQRAGPTNLPPGTTSAERFAMANQSLAGQRSNPVPNNPFTFGRPPGMPMGTSMSRSGSSKAPGGQIPPSPHVSGSQRGSTRVGSKRDKMTSKRTDEENRSMPLTATMDLKPIQVSSSGWKPRSLGQGGGSGPAPDGHMAPDVVQRKVKGLLNKMTPEKFERIADQILEIAAQSKNESDGRTLRQVIQLTFEKATDEAHWASTYASFCERTLEFMSPEIKDENIKDKHGNVVTGGALFRKYLLNRCQEEFERGWKVNMPPKPEGQTEEAALMSEEYYVAAAAKRRGLGLVKFIGELYKLGMLTGRIMRECIKKLLELDESGPDESEVESLVSLLNTVGANLEQMERGSALMDAYFERITSIMNHPDLPSRLKYKLMDVIDLRKRGWQSRRDDRGPMTIGEIHAEAQRKQQEAELERARQQSNRGGRMPMGRGDVRNFSGGRGTPPQDYTSNNVGTDDLRRLGARTTRNSSNPGGPVLGPSSLLSGSRTNSGRRGLGPTGSLFGRGEDSGASSRTGTPPQREKDKKEDGAKSSNNAFRYS